MAGFLIKESGFTWKQSYLITIPLVLLFFLTTLPLRFPGKTEDDQAADGTASNSTASGAEEKISFGQALKNPTVWAFSITLGLMVVIEFSSSNWGGLYFQDVYGFDPSVEGAAFVSKFYIFFTVSRLLSGFAIEKIGYMRSLFISCFGALIVFALGFLFKARGIYILPVLGFFIGMMWPTIMAVAIIHFKKNAAVFTSAIIVLGGALNAGLQAVIGITNRRLGPAWGYRSSMLYALIMTICLFILHSRIKQKEKVSA
jgi:fucose permease